MPDFPEVISLSGLNGATGFRLDGAAAGDEAGVSVAGAGDVNGDGYDDLIVGAWLADPHGNASGNTYVVFGSDAGFPSSIALGSLNGSNGFVMRGVGASDGSGFSVAGVGDLNGDGLDDMFVGAPYAKHGTGSFLGGGYVVYGATSFGSAVELSALNGTTGFRITGVENLGLAGQSVSGGGDFNNDGVADLVIGAYRNANGGPVTGETFVLYGKTTGSFPSSFSLSSVTNSTGARFRGIDSEDWSGWWVDSLGDFNGDGFDDILIGAPQGDAGGDTDAGEAYIVFGGTSSLTLGSLGTHGVRLDGIAANDRAGTQVASAGDVNGDGYDDVIVGAPNADGGGADAGEAYVLFGSATPGTSVDLATLNGVNGFSVRGLAAGDWAGVSVEGAGDVNGDGYADIIVGAFRRDAHSATDSGESYVIFGRAEGFAATFDLATLNGTNGFRIEGIDPTDRAGNAVASAGDLNNDGFDDLIVGARNANLASGEAYVIFGRAPTASVNRVGTVASQSLAGGAGDDTLDGRDGDDELRGNAGDDSLIGGAGKDMLVGGADDDSLSGGSGADTLLGGTGSDSLVGGSGNDLLDGGAGGDVMNGGSGDDRYIVDSTGDQVIELSDNGDDQIDSSVSYALANGLYVERLVLTGNQANSGVGNTLDNIITGNGAANLIAGGEGNDQLDGGAGADQMKGGAGNDIFYVDNINDKPTENAGAGIDSVVSSISFTLPGMEIELLYLTGSATDGTGNAVANQVFGNNLANTLVGNEGDDLLVGNGDNDVLRGGVGNDTLQGGIGADKFYFDTDLSAATNVDSVIDFEVGTDEIFLRRSKFGGIGAAGDLSAAAFVTGSQAMDASDRIIYNPATGALYFDPDGTGAAAQVQFASVTIGLALTSTDFTLY